MSFTYCKLCGHKNLYSVNVPKFCGGCGEPLDGSSVAATRQTEKKVLPEKPSRRKKRTRPINDGDVSESDGTDINYVPQIEDLQCEILGLDSMARVMKIEDLIPEIKEEPSGKKTKRKPGRPRKRKQG